MALPLPALTFYRMPDARPVSGAIDSLLDAIYTTLTSSTDYRGNAISSSHSWSWGRSQVGGLTNAIYNTTVPTGSGLTTNFSIIIGGAGTASPTMLTPDTFVASGSHVGIVRNPSTYNDWISSTPMTSGAFSGYWRMTPVGANSTSTVVRSFVSEESIFIQVIQNGTTQYWLHGGAILEPYTSCVSGGYATAESDDRLLGLFTSYTAITSDFTEGTYPTYVNTNGSNHAGVFVPKTTGFGPIVRSNPGIWTTIDGEKDFSGNWIAKKISTYYLRTSVGTTLMCGYTRSFMWLGKSLSAMNVFRSGSTDLYHAVLYNTGAASVCAVLKAVA